MNGIEESHPENKKVEVDGLIYSINQENNTASIIDGKSSVGDIFIPYSININEKEYVISTILQVAFNESKNIDSIQFSNESKIHTIEEMTFNNSSIKSISIPPHLKHIKRCAFGSCKQLKQFIIPENSELQNIDELAFNNSSIETFIIPPHLTKISRGLFFKCNELKTIEIPENSELQTIEDEAFFETSIESLYFPASLVNLGKKWCLNTPKITKIDINHNNPRYKAYEDGKLIIGKSSIESNNYEILVFCVRNIENVIIPSFIKTISQYAFDNCNQLKEVKTASNSILQTIEDEAFHGSSIESISFPETLVDLKEKWCSNVSKLSKISIDKNNPRYSLYDEGKFIIGKSSIESTDFDILVYCVRNIKFATLPKFIKTIAQYSFESCQIQTIEIPSDSSLEIIENEAFQISLINSIVFPSNLIKIGSFAFGDCPNLRKVDFHNDSKLEIIEERAFAFTQIESISIPYRLTKIDGVFVGCSCLKKIIFPDNSKIKTITKFAFANTLITSFVFPIHISEIDNSIFFHCYHLQIIEIQDHSQLKMINCRLFSRCYNPIIIMVNISSL